MKRLLLALCFALPALAQPIVGPELTTPPVDRGGDIAIAAQRDGYVVAWSTAGHILAGHLDSTLQLTDAPLDLDLGDAAGFPTSLSIATNGESVLVEWLETKPYASGIHAATLSGDARTLRHTPELVELGSPAADFYAGSEKATEVIESAVAGSVSEVAKLSRNIQQALYQDAEAFLAGVDKLASAKSFNEAFQIQSDLLRARGEVLVSRAKASTEYLGKLVTEGAKTAQDNLAKVYSKTA